MIFDRCLETKKFEVLLKNGILSPVLGLTIEVFIKPIGELAVN